MGNEVIHSGSVSKGLPVILYVDDQPSHRTLFQKVFQSKYRILTASSGEEALEMAKDPEIFLVIADHNMPGMSGVDFLERSESLLPKAERAILSAYLDDDIVRQATQRVKLAAQLAKPWKLDGMRGFIERAYEKYAVAISRTPEITPEKTPAVPQTEVVTEEPPVSSLQLAHVTEMMSEAVDRQGARRIFLSFVEPRLKEYFPLIRRPYPDLLQKAQQEALKGNFDGVQKQLSDYLKAEGIETILSNFGAVPKRKLH